LQLKQQEHKLLVLVVAQVVHLLLALEPTGKAQSSLCIVKEKT
jgi:hypothetical protein